MTITSAEQAELEALKSDISDALRTIVEMSAELERLRAESAHLRAELKLFIASLDGHVAQKIEDAEENERLREALDEQRAEVARMFKDTKRYQFLRDKAWGQYGALALLPPAEMDAAIDAAMREQAMQALAEQAQELDMGYGERK